VLWSVNIVVVRVALHSSGPLTYSTLRFMLGGLGLWWLAHRIEGPIRWPSRREWLLIFAAAGTGVALTQAAFTAALALTSPDFVAMFLAGTPLLVTAWVAWHASAHFTVKVWVGLGVGLLGVALVVFTAGRAHVSWFGVTFALASPVSGAIYVLLLPPLLRRYRPLSLAAIICLVGGLMLAPFGLAEGIAHPPRVSGEWLGLLGFSVVAVVVAANWLYFIAVRVLGPARTATYTYLEPLLTVAAASVLIGERVMPLQLVGGVVILIGLGIGTPGPLGISGPTSGGGDVPEAGSYSTLNTMLTPSVDPHECGKQPEFGANSGEPEWSSRDVGQIVGATGSSGLPEQFFTAADVSAPLVKVDFQ
jgi:drug/metabolite transporter (DMT)-like permease